MTNVSPIIAETIGCVSGMDESIANKKKNTPRIPEITFDMFFIVSFIRTSRSRRI